MLKESSLHMLAPFCLNYKLDLVKSFIHSLVYTSSLTECPGNMAKWSSHVLQKKGERFASPKDLGFGSKKRLISDNIVFSLVAAPQAINYKANLGVYDTDHFAKRLECLIFSFCFNISFVLHSN